jgi:Kef-type K+ transport system membrane component KefB
VADHTLAIFAAELILLLLVGRLIGELMNRLGQPALFGQLIAGVLLGPSVFGLLWPEAHRFIFPDNKTLKTMIDAVSQIGILLLLLLTGMETNLALVRRRKRVVVSSSLSGIAVPFVLGVALAYLLPGNAIPMHENRLVTALFLGTALSISSVKILAMVLIDIGAMRRDLGQLMLATAILDDSLAWIIIAVISGIAAHGQVDLVSIGGSIAGTALFLAFSLTLGRRLVTRLIVWVNDHMTIEVPVITTIIVIMLVMSLTTELIGVHTALGAFIAGILVGQSPILTEQIENQLRGFVFAFFSPVFFAVAGLGMDLRTLFDPTLALFTLAIIVVASIGKFSGALVGGRLGGLTLRESLALGVGLNARGSTEVIIASIGLAMGALSNQLYTMIVAMAVITTMAMPPMLRWVMARVPLGEEEAKRLENEDAEALEHLPKMERALVYADDSPNGRLASRIAGLFAARHEIQARTTEEAARRAHLADAAHSVHAETEDPLVKKPILDQLVTERPLGPKDDIERELARGYDIVFVGIDKPIAESQLRFEERLGPRRRAARHPPAGRRHAGCPSRDRNRHFAGGREQGHRHGLARVRSAGGYRRAARAREARRHVRAGRRPSRRQARRRAGKRPDGDQRPAGSGDPPCRPGRPFRPRRARHIAAPWREPVPRPAHGGAIACDPHAGAPDRTLIAYHANCRTYDAVRVCNATDIASILRQSTSGEFAHVQ